MLTWPIPRELQIAAELVFVAIVSFAYVLVYRAYPRRQSTRQAWPAAADTVRPPVTPWVGWLAANTLQAFVMVLGGVLLAAQPHGSAARILAEFMVAGALLAILWARFARVSGPDVVESVPMKRVALVGELVAVALAILVLWLLTRSC
jgi:hypothetical protein